MGNDIHHTIVKFFEARMREHSMVASFDRLDVGDDITYEITRAKFDDKVRIWLCDAYIFTEMDFLNRPSLIKAGDYILIAKPEGGGGLGLHLISNYKIGVGKIGDLMGALTMRDMWKYLPPTPEEKAARRLQLRP
jgi:hypothetical protein